MICRSVGGLEPFLGFLRILFSLILHDTFFIGYSRFVALVDAIYVFVVLEPVGRSVEIKLLEILLCLTKYAKRTFSAYGGSLVMIFSRLCSTEKADVEGRLSYMRDWSRF